MHKLAKNLFLAIIIYLTGALIIHPEICLESAQRAIILCFDTVIPILFPFFVCSGLLTSLGFSAICSRVLSPIMRPLFRLPGSAAQALCMGIISGYPVGAVTAVNLYSAGQCTKSEAQRMISFCNNSGPLFIIGVVGGNYLQSPTMGIRLYISHIIAAITVGLIFRFIPSEHYSCRQLPSSVDKKNVTSSIGGVMDSSVNSILKVCGFVIFFAVFSSFLPSFPLLYPFVEVVGGIKNLASQNIANLPPCISFFLAFSGLSVIFQVYSIVNPYGISIKPYVLGKLAQGIISFIITHLSLIIFPDTVKVFASSTESTMIALSPFSLVAFSALTAILGTLSLALIMAVLAVAQKKGAVIQHPEVNKLF